MVVNSSMTKEISATTEEYLENIYRLQQRDGAARTNSIVKLLQVAPGTVTNTIERLEKEELVSHVPYQGVKLTEKGRKIAIDILRKHGLLERLLTDILHLNWENVHDEACRLEHDISEKTVSSLEIILGNPKTCPHGNAIPTRSGEVSEEKSESLTNLEVGEKGVVARITEEEPELLQYLSTLKLKPNANVEVVEKAPFDGPLTVRVAGANRALSRAIADIIKVQKT
jgi:DtxR family Mn-dependent transcriptional regulator